MALCQYLMDNYRVSVRRDCSLMLIGSSVYYYRSRGWDDTPLRNRIREIAISRVRYGCRRIYILLRREGWTDNHKRVHRLYREEGLNLRAKRPRRLNSGAHRLERSVGSGLHQVWSMDLVSDALFNGSRFRALTIVDNCSRVFLAIVVGKSPRGADVVDTLESIRLARDHMPHRFQTDNGSEFIFKEVDR
jgi:putative transposase